MNLFEKASRLKFRFDTPQGQLTPEDLWDLPLTSSRVGRANLDDIAISLNKQIQEQGTMSYVKKASSNRDVLQAKFDLVLHIIGVLQAEAEQAATRLANATKRNKILEIIESKEDEALTGKSVEELQALAASL